MSGIGDSPVVSIPEDGLPEAEPQLQQGASISKSDDPSVASSEGQEGHQLFGNAVERADLADLEDLEERSLTLIEGRRMSDAAAASAVFFQSEEQAARTPRKSLAERKSIAARKSVAGRKSIAWDLPTAEAQPADERSMRDYTIERKSITEPGQQRSQRLSEYTARVAGHGSIFMQAALLLENSLSDKHATATAEKMAWMPIVGESIYRFDDSDAARQQAAPSLSFENPQLREQRVDVSEFENKSPAFLPVFELDEDKQIVEISLPPGTTFHGTGEVGGSLERSGKRICTWNTDAWGYNQNTTSLYQSHPWVFSMLATGEAFGALADTTLRCEIDLSKDTTIRFVAVAPYPVITFGPFRTSEAIFAAFARVIGTVQLPPKWALGYHQCRFSYDSAAKVLKIAHTFREKKIPCDVIWMDIDYMQGYKCFTFDRANFPNPTSLSSQLHRAGFKGIWMLDPGIKVEEGYEVYESGSEANVWVQAQNGKPYVGECWPGSVVFPDFTNKKARKWWSALVKKFVGNGIDGIWNDMNEPAVFKTVTKTMPETNNHRGDEDIGGVQPHSYYHNVYGMFQAKATLKGMLQASKDKRPFVLTRAGFVGAQRYAATWTGDNLSTWEHLGMSIPMCLNLGLSGQPFAGPDIGGFVGDATPKLFARWMGIGAMLPFARGHSEKGTIDQEPWSFGSEVELVCKFAINRRYRLLPHIYTLFYQSYKTGMPVMAPLFFADLSDPQLRKRDDGFLLGPLLVSACHTMKNEKANLEAVLPQGIWHRFHFDDDNPELPLLFLKGGGIVPTGPVIQHMGEAKHSDTITLLVALDEKDKAEGHLYEDDGDGFGFKHGKFLLTHYEASRLSSESDEVVIKISRAEGQWPRPNRHMHVRLLIGNSTQVEGECKDGLELRIKVPPKAEIEELVATKRKFEISERERTPTILDEAPKRSESVKGVGGVMSPIDLQAGNLTLKVVPWIGGRIVSMIHKPSGYEWLEGRFETGCYEEYSGSEYRAAGCTEEYHVVRHLLETLDGQEFLGLDGDIGGGLVMSRDILVALKSPDKVNITSRIQAKSIGAGAGGESRVVRLRIHPLMKLVNPTHSVIKYTTINGTKRVHEAIESGEISIEGPDRPNGEWMLKDTDTGLAVINRFNINEVVLCLISWSPGSVTMELWSEERPVTKETPLRISHDYEFFDAHMDAEEDRISHEYEFFDAHMDAEEEKAKEDEDESRKRRNRGATHGARQNVPRLHLSGYQLTSPSVLK